MNLSVRKTFQCQTLNFMTLIGAVNQSLLTFARLDADPDANSQESGHILLS